MDWKKLVAELTEAGLTQTQIAEQCGVSQSSVSDLNRGQCQSPSFDFGTRLVKLHQERVRANEKPQAGSERRSISRLRQDDTVRELERVVIGVRRN